MIFSFLAVITDFVHRLNFHMYCTGREIGHDVFLYFWLLLLEVITPFLTLLLLYHPLNKGKNGGVRKIDSFIRTTCLILSNLNIYELIDLNRGSISS
jgi:hypothetical protein